jgi:hypothetical protein
MAYIYNADNSYESSTIRFRKDVNTHIYEGGNVSYMLNVIINEPTTNDIANQIRHQVFQKINNFPIRFNINQTDVVITWRSNDNLHYYHADVMGMYGDVAVKLHTEMLLKLFDDDCCGKTKLSFMVNKPLVRTIPINSVNL